MKDWRSSFDERFPRSVKQCFVDYGIDNCIKDELPENCVHESKETCGYYKDYYLMYGTDDIKDFIEALIKETEQNTAKEIVEYCEKHKTVRKVNGVRYINIEQLREKYKGVE
jgi:hypothetical protein